jgi:uncharacterized protein (DUF58 family)
VLVVVGAALWVRLIAKPVRLRRAIRGGNHVAGEDVPVTVELDVEGRVTPRNLAIVETVERHGSREVELVRRAGTRLRGDYVIDRVPRGRFPFLPAQITIEDPFGLERRDVELEAPGALLVYPRLVHLDTLFSETGSRVQEGRRLLMRRPSGFDLHSVRDYVEGESLRRVHWPTTAKRGRLMVKDLEDSPRDEALVILDADAAHVTGEGVDSSFEVVVAAAGSILHAHGGRGRRAALLLNALVPRYQPVHTLDGDWELALELLASVKPDGKNGVAAMLVDGAGAPSKALELCVVTSGLSSRLTDRLLQRSVTRRGTSVVYVDAVSFGPRPPDGPPADAKVQLARLSHAGIAVCVIRRGDDLAACLTGGLAPGAAAVG